MERQQKARKQMKAKEDVKLALDAKEHELDADTEFLKTLTGLPTRFTFKELESATANFGLKLGRGGFGSVYEGILSDGCKVAVKRLEREGHGQKEFCAEVATISRVRHLNLVFLKGFCVEGAERLLVYEYMSGGSLDRWIFQDKISASDSVPAKFIVLSWKTRFDIALDIARGLTYLHEECEEKILHLDIKPQNILLDTKFHAKLSDFGLSRSMDRAQSRVLTTMRGTPGYLAPEWFNDEGIDIKADVYGYGMVLLELVSGRRSVDQSQSNPENWYLPTMAFKKVQNKAALELVDPMLIGTLDAADCHQIVMSVNIALWCIQDKVSLRPKMSTVVQMLDGSTSVEDPPCSSMLMSKQRLPLSSVSNITVIDAETISIPR
ncbi:hypothetical protein KP509_02G029700 [Ceratopteris richardii]|uniref:non-specific serine/threonine protein kinase n=1 Tax=Ceratopteris richardii TaxID=49495 RepID=A0A8T2V7H0_CERRI|nr:hypothetical protein KP509_02G029700 [Ceratopteris richardii]